MRIRAIKRITFFLVLLILIFYVPFWMLAVLCVVGMFVFDSFWEGVIFLALSQLLFGLTTGEGWNMFFLAFFLPVLMLLGVEFLKKKLKFYDK